MTTDTSVPMVAALPPLPETPGELGLDPVKFPAWRPGQREIITMLARWFVDTDESSPRVFMLEAPTGTGKSLIAAGLAAYLWHNGLLHGPDHEGAIISTMTRNLQHQYVEGTFEGADVRHQSAVDGGNEPVRLKWASSWGRAGHQCLIVNATADKGPCTAGFKCPERHRCTYYSERDAAQDADVAILNTAMYMTCVNYVRAAEGTGRGGETTTLFDGAALAIHDEAHVLERAVQSMVEVKLDRSWFNAMGLPPLPLNSEYPDWEGYIDVVLTSVELAANRAEDTAKQLARMDPPQVLDDPILSQAPSMFRKLRQLYFRLLPARPLITHDRDSVVFRAIWGADFAEEYLFRYAYKHLLMSATIPHPEYTAQTLGLKPGEWKHITLPNPFAVARRQIYYRPVVRMNMRTTPAEFAEMVDALDDIIEQNAAFKGIVHSVSYARAQQILELSRFRTRMITHKAGARATQSAIEMYLEADEPVVLVSPSVGVGEDFGRGDNCRFQVFVKYPVPNLGDPVVNARKEESPNSLWYEADMAFIQGVGRGTRSADDWCRNYLLDKGAAHRLPRLPASIQTAIVR